MKSTDIFFSWLQWRIIFYTFWGEGKKHVVVWLQLESHEFCYRFFMIERIQINLKKQKHIWIFCTFCLWTDKKVIVKRSNIDKFYSRRVKTQQNITQLLQIYAKITWMISEINRYKQKSRSVEVYIFRQIRKR